MNKIIKLLFFLFAISLFAKEIRVKGSGQNIKEAKSNALVNLSSYIQVEVYNNIQTTSEIIARNNNVDSEETMLKITRLKNELPIIGAKFENEKKTWKESIVEAVFNPDEVLPIYEKKVSDLINNLERDNKILKRTIGTENKITILNKMLMNYEQYLKYRTVAIFLGSNENDSPEITDSDIRVLLNDVMEEVDSIDYAAKLLAEDIDKSNLFISPPTTRNSHEITQFAAVFRDKLVHNLTKKRFVISDSQYDAEYYLYGNYDILDNHISVTYRMLDNSFNTIKSKTVKLSPDAYSTYKIQPSALSFDKLLYSGYIISNDFKCELSTNKGKTNLVFKRGDLVKITIKMNHPGYLYIVGHVKKDDEDFSYLLELYPQLSGNDKFIRYIGPDETNKYVVLGEFEVSPPLGIDALQLIASNNKMDSLPGVKYDSGYYVVSSDSTSGVSKTRGFKPPSNAVKKILSAEDVLMITTMER